MPTIRTDDGVDLHYEETGSGTPMAFVHEFAGDLRSWEPQVRYFSRRYRCVAFNARGYPPSAVPTDPAAYSQDRATDDIACVIRTLGLAPAHVVGCSMGAFAAVHMGLRHPELCRSIVASGVGYGAVKAQQEGFRADSQAVAAGFRANGMAATATSYLKGPSRLIFEQTDPRGYAEMVAGMCAHSAEGSALTLLGVQSRRPSLYDLEARLSGYTTPLLVMCGDEDDGTLEPGIFLKRVVPTSGLVVFPKCGHTQNLEEPALFNDAVLSFVTRVEAGRWPRRIPASQSGSLLVASKP